MSSCLIYFLKLPGAGKGSMREKKFVSVISACILAFVLLDCAGQVEPGGGPRDTVPPRVVSTVPDSNAIHIEQSSVELEFSEYVDRRSVEESIFISPYVGDLEFDWSTTGVTIQFSQPLRKNTTYVVNVGTDVVDLREKNRMAAGFTLAFSTGDSIDRGYIGGRVFDEKPEGIMIFAYALKDLNPDTLNPGDLRPDYIMQTGKGGIFRLANVAYGKYRLFAVRDQYRNLIYDKQIDQYGVTISDVDLTAGEPRIEDVQFRLSQEDTTKPFVTNVQAVNRILLRVRFSEALDTSSSVTPSVTLEDTVRRGPVKVSVVYVSCMSPSMAGVVTATPLDSGGTYRIRIDGVRDTKGNPIDADNSAYVFTATGVPDTVPPSLTVQGIADSSRGYPPDRSIQIGFSEPVLEQPLARAISLSDSSKMTMDAELRWIDAVDVMVIPRQPLQSKTWYRLSVAMSSLKDLQGNGHADSTFIVRFETLDLRSTGVVEGMVTDENHKQGKGRIYLTASSIDVKPVREQTIVLNGPGKFRMDRLVEGKYVLQGFRDADSSGSYSFGLPYPYIPSERFAVYADTLKVRARWSVGGVMLRFK